MKVLPKEVTIGQVMELANQVTTQFAIDAPGFFMSATLKLPKREAPGLLTSWLRALIGPEPFDEVMSATESPEVTDIKAKIAEVKAGLEELGRAWDFTQPNATGLLMLECAPYAVQLEILQAELDKLNNVEAVVMAKALELFGLDVPDKVNFDYKVNTLVWRQQVGATMEKYGSDRLITFPLSTVKDTVKVHKDDLDKIAVAVPMVDMKDNYSYWNVVAMISSNGENSTFFKAISRELLGKAETSDGINAVSVYEGEPLPVIVAKDVVRV